MNKLPRKQQNKQLGVTMIEVLVTMVIVAIGLMGMSTLQMLSLKNANSSHYRYQAALLAYDMEERMRANETARASGSYNAIDIDTADAITSRPSAPSTSAAIASMDIYEWDFSMRDSKLPSATGSVTLNGGLYDIQVTWTEQQTGGGIADSAASHETKSFNISVSL